MGRRNCVTVTLSDVHRSQASLLHQHQAAAAAAAAAAAGSV